jgi:uncharacterized membrane-anchored protein YitT (DUF2179 family)
MNEQYIELSQLIRRSLIILIGTLLVGFGINRFLIPHHLLDGGVVGIALLINYIWGLKPGFAFILISIPIFYMAWMYQRQYFYNSLHGMLLSSLAIDLLRPFSLLPKYPIALSAVLGGITIGAGVGIMLRHQTSTGGTDLVAQLIAQRTALNIGLLIFLIDAVVILCSARIIGMERTFFTAVTVTCGGFTTGLLTTHHG